ncbi:MAG: SAM-dependent methyltransferase [Alphaproteobacteria bacterium]|nr:SAM-dependent methyltransferase [Alphaproteobacteria bacterium]
MDQSPLRRLIIDEIAAGGPLSIERYWELCQYHPDYGYYMCRDPVGARGDFTTAPEISQLFGEMIGIWAMERWQAMGAPRHFHLIECGPGHGTLMADLLRIAAVLPDFLAACQLHMIEISPHLRDIQRQTLSQVKQAAQCRNITWHADIKDIPLSSPVIIIGNEFFDAIPIRQYIWKDERWRERRVEYNGQEFVLTDAEISAVSMPLSPAAPPQKGATIADGAIMEWAPIRDKICDQILQILKSHSGSALFIDYGYEKFEFGDSLQAIYKHKYSNILENQGVSDITSHVNFEQMAYQVKDYNFNISLYNQREFLISTGIFDRANQLKRALDLSKELGISAQDIDIAVKRLVSVDQMGQIFKVISINNFSRNDLRNKPDREKQA